MPLKFLLFLLIGTILMFFPIAYVSRREEYPIWKSVIISLFLTVAGTVGTLLMFFVENGRFGGISFFGAVFFVPIAFAICPILFGIPYTKLMDMCALGECVMLVIMKIHCMLSGCCIGRIIFGDIRFPARIAEMLVAAVIFTVLLKWYKTSKNHGSLYAYYLIFYGVARFVLNLLRDIPKSDKMPLPYGNIWSLVAIVFGLLWLFIMYYKKINKEYKSLNKE